jgi:ParB/RepB/Spo0J family partition protein
MDQNDVLSDEAFESQIDADSAEPVAAAPAKAEEPTGSPIIDRLKEISADISGRIPPPDPSVIAPDSPVGRLFAAFFTGDGDIPDKALAEFQRLSAEANGTAVPAGAPIASRPHRSPRLAVTKRDLYDRLRRTDVRELLDGQIPTPDSEPVIDVELGRISTEFENMRSTNDEETDATLESSMVALRQFVPLVGARDRDNPERIILLAGFSRFRIAQKRGWPTVKVLVRTLNSELEAFLLNLLENIGHAPVGTYDLAVRCDLIISKFALSVPELAKLIGRTPAYVYQLRSLLTSLPSNARKDWQNRHPAATLPKLAAVSREFDKVAAWEKVRAQHEKAVGKVLSSSIDIDDDEAETEKDSSGWEEYKRPSKAAIRRMRDVVSRAKLPTDPKSMRELAIGLLDWARGASSKVPHVLAPPLKKRPQRRTR